MPNRVLIKWPACADSVSSSCRVVIAASGQRAYSAAPFYEGKAIRIIVGTAPGGGYDTYTRLIARHFEKYIPGSPTIIVDNMPGAGGLVSANHLFNPEKPDGLTVGHFVGGQFLQQLLGKPGIEFDAAKFEYIGVPAQDNFVFGVAKTTGITGVEQGSENAGSCFALSQPATGPTILPKLSRLLSACRSRSYRNTRAPRRFAWHSIAARLAV